MFGVVLCAVATTIGGLLRDAGGGDQRESHGDAGAKLPCTWYGYSFDYQLPKGKSKVTLGNARRG